MTKTITKTKKSAKMMKSSPVQKTSSTSQQKKSGKTLPLSKLTLMLARIKNLHVMTRKYSEHKILDQAFDDMNKALDSFIECTQGYYGDLSIDTATIPFEIEYPDNLIEGCTNMMNEFIQLASEVCKPEEKDQTINEAIESALGSVRDDVVLKFLQVKYLLFRQG